MNQVSNLLHKRLAHTNNNNIKLMIENNAAEGLNTSKEKDGCIDCYKGKMTVENHPYIGPKNLQPGEQFTIDLTGPLPKSGDLSTYIHIMKDRKSCYRYVYITETKEAKKIWPQIAKTFMALKNQHNITVKIFKNEKLQLIRIRRLARSSRHL